MAIKQRKNKKTIDSSIHGEGFAKWFRTIILNKNWNWLLSMTKLYLRMQAEEE
jgi:hypothetical protein